MIIDAADLALIEVQALEDGQRIGKSPIVLALIAEVRRLRAENARLRCRVRTDECLNDRARDDDGG